MATVYLGAISLGEYLAGVKVAIDPLADALAFCKAKANIVLTAVATCEAAVKVAVDAALASLLDIKAKVRLAALADLQAQLDAAVAITAALQVSITDPATYLSGLIQGSVQVQANLGVLVPTVALNAQLGAAVALEASLTAKIAAFDLVLDLILGVPAALKVAIDAAFDALINATAELIAAIQAIDLSLPLALDLQAKLSLSAVVAYRFDAQLQDAGNELDALITSGSTGGLLLTDNVRGWLVVVPTSSVALLDAVTAVLKSAP